MNTLTPRAPLHLDAGSADSENNNNNAPAPHAEAALSSAAAQAVTDAEQGFGGRLAITPQERDSLTQMVKGNLQGRAAAQDSATPLKAVVEGPAFLDMLCRVRRRGWANDLLTNAQKQGDVWVRRADATAAANQVKDPLATQAALEDALAAVVEKRWRTLGDTPEDVQREARGEFSSMGLFLTAKQGERLAQSIGRAFGGVDGGLADEMLVAEERRERERAEIRRRAEERKAQELERLRQWEATLVDFDALPAILHCSRREALRWFAENRLPIAQRETLPDGQEVFRFDPAELKSIKPLVRHWREGRNGPAHAPITEPEAAQQVAGESAVALADAEANASSAPANAAIARVASMDRFAGHFTTARSMKRRITLVTGPTNSGKSHTALTTLANAESGVALAPLRLLAHEFREALVSRGVPASLTTGEERIIDPTAKHNAATVEMCGFNRPVDVALIDEAQMLSDQDRGAAWTAAIMGVPARHIFILGAADCIPHVKRIAALCGDEVDEIHLERKSPLKAGGALALEELTTGDALIAFSRREVLDLRAQLMAQGKKVAVIYGALSPEVRRAEAARFNSGEADVLIATDAIGMGLNLSIKRVVFSSLQKFDGRNTRTLTTQEIKQIGGRAGRYGMHEEGLVCVLEGAGSPTYIKKMLDAPPEPQEELRPYVQPDADIIQAVADEIGTDSLYGVLARIKRAVLRPDDPNYRLADMDQSMEIAAALEGIDGLDLQTRWTYAMCPVNTRDNDLPLLVDWAAQHARGQKVPPPGMGMLPRPELASNEELGRAEKRHRLLVTWRWLAQRFPEVYADIEGAEKTAADLNEWIEGVLRNQSQMRESSRQRQGYRSGGRGRPGAGGAGPRPGRGRGKDTPKAKGTSPHRGRAGAGTGKRPKRGNSKPRSRA
ncbi:RNA helicase [Formicincola oecophyllae]|uniref:RNA helicase n=1 Tax=Formicincola oecophyllae TaxID=2558361 RepID=A0A4Y6UBK1_9PROT|nr:helicase-related protein [Formicincola oecophyllae]QDH13856.1 RNA helicase [Formicincola oecophyllae]